MEIEEINHSSCKRSRVGNGKLQPGENHQDEDEEDGEAKGERNNINNNNNTSSASNSNSGRMVRPWNHPSSRIIRVSRASGGKDRHSKVITAKGLRDRRVRLSVSTAIQFYDLQDRLGYDQPSKAIEWLIKAAASAIAELPSLDTNFPEPAMDHHHHQQLNMEQPMPSDSLMDPDADPSYNQQQHSSTSETSKGSVSTRSESRVRAGEKAKERVMDKKKDRDDAHVVSHHQNVANPSLNSQGSFTELLTGGSSSAAAVAATAGQASSSTANFIQKQMQHNLPPATSTADYFGMQSSLFGQQQPPPQPKASTIHQISTSGFSSQAHFGNSSPIGMVPLTSGNAGDGHPGTEMQQFAFLQDHFFPVAAAAAAASGGDYYLNFSISPSLAGFHRGTLQSNSPAHHHQHQLSHHHHHHHHQVQAQRLPSAVDGSSVPFFFGAAAPAAASSPAENPYASGFDGHLQLCEGYKHLEVKGKGKS